MTRVVFMRNWSLMPGAGLAIGAAKKCGSCSVQQMADYYVRRIFENIPSAYHRVGIIREPVDRFRSLYLHVRRGFGHDRTTDFYKPYRYMPVDEFWEGIEPLIEQDEHIYPQAKIGLLEADQVVRLENMEAWALGLGLEFPHKNIRPKGSLPRYTVDLSAELESKIRAAYASDMTLWENANG